MVRPPALSKELAHHKKTYILGGDEPEGSVHGYAFILTFEKIDFPNWDEEHEKLTQALRAISFSVNTLYMDSSQFKTNLQKFLDGRFRKPRLICVRSHGGEHFDGLHLAASPRAPNSIRWSTIQDIVVPAKCDVLLIVSCCCSGLATIPRQNRYAKELISVGSWNENSYGFLMTAIICTAMERWYKNQNLDELTAEKLYEYISRGTDHTRNTKKQECQERIDVLRQTRDKLCLEIRSLDEDMKKLSVGPEQRMHQAVKANEVDEELDAVKRGLRKEQNELAQIKVRYTQPHYSKEYMKWEGDFEVDSPGAGLKYWKLPRP